MNLTDFIHGSNGAKNVEDASDFLLRFLANFGFDRFLIAEFSHSSSIDEKEKKFGTVTNYPQEWLGRYFARHYVNIDPVYKMAIHANAPFTWETALKINNSSMAARMMGEAKEYGLRTGVASVIHRPLNKLIGFSFASSQDEVRKDKDALSLLHVASVQYYAVYSDLIGAEKTPPTTLTEREREVLLWIANGKSKSETADILFISESCVKRHCESIFKKLEVNNLAFAAARAIRMGILDPF